jgi:hypothetical protein
MNSEIVDDNEDLQIETAINEIETEQSFEENIDPQNKTLDHESDKESPKIELEKEPALTVEYFEPESKRKILPFVVFPILVIALSIALYYYLEHYKKGETISKKQDIVLNTNNANIIKRSFEIPVTYPYLPKATETTISELVPKNQEKDEALIISTDNKTNDIKKTESIKQEKSVQQNNVSQNQVSKKDLPSGTALNVGNNIYKYGNYYVVQVAAFRSNSISENEAGKYRNKGYNAFVEEAQIPDRGTWYRVRVGNFSTLEEARIFSSNNIR